MKEKLYITNKEYDIFIVELRQNDGLHGYSFLDIEDKLFMDNLN